MKTLQACFCRVSLRWRRFEVMGYLQGKIVDDTFVIMDSLQVDAAFSEVPCCGTRTTQPMPCSAFPVSSSVHSCAVATDLC